MKNASHAKHLDQLMLKKSIHAIVMVPKIGKLTVTARKLFNMVLHSTQQQISDFVATGKEVPAGHMFQSKFSDLVYPIELGKSDLRTAGKAYFQELTEIGVEWNAPDKNQDPETNQVAEPDQDGMFWRKYHLLSDAELHKENGVIVAKWMFSSTVFNILKSPKLYAKINILELAKLSSYESVVLYEICSRYKENPSGVTSSHEPNWWVRAFCAKLPALNPETNEPNWRDWPRLKNEKVLSAVAEINDHTDLQIKLLETKDWKTIVSVQFEVKLKSSSKAAEIEAVAPSPKLSQKVAEFAGKLELNLGDVLALSKIHSDVALVDAMIKLEARMNQEDTDPVKSKLAYLKTILQELDGLVNYSKPTIQTVMPAVAHQVSASKVKPLEIVHDYKTTRTKEIKEELLNQPIEVKKKYAEKALEKLTEIKLLTPSMAIKVRAGNFENAFLVSHMIEIYAADVYGSDWGTEQQADSLAI
jgi:plasmid replication initiation protein